MLAAFGVTWIETSAAVVTVSVVPGELTPLKLAPMLVMPTPDAEASPLEPAALLMLATLPFEEAQVTAAVRSCVELSVNVPVALNCCVSPLGILGEGGVTWIDTRVAGVT